MSAVTLEIPQTLNLYAYCGNDPINITDPNGLFWKAIGNFFKSIGKFFSAVSKVVLRILNNTYVSWVATIVGLLVGLPPIAKALGKFAEVLSKAISIYNKIKNIAGYISIAGEVFQGNFKTLGLAALGAIPAIIEDSILAEIQKVAGSSQKFSIRAYLKGFGKGFKDRVHRIRTVFKRKLKDMLTPIYGFFCGGGYGTPTGERSPRVDTYDEGVCHPHDDAYVRAREDFAAGKITAAEMSARLTSADKTFWLGGIVSATKGHLVDRMFKVDVGLNMRFLQTTTIGLQGAFRMLN
jgi:hypothetical protein